MQTIIEVEHCNTFAHIAKLSYMCMIELSVRINFNRSLMQQIVNNRVDSIIMACYADHFIHRSINCYA